VTDSDAKTEIEKYCVRAGLNFPSELWSKLDSGRPFVGLEWLV